MAENTDKLNVLKARLIELKQKDGNRTIDNNYLDEIIDIAEDCFKEDQNSKASHFKVVKKK